MTNQSNTQDPSKVSGRYHSVKGSIVKGLGDMTGSESMQQSGKEEHARGETEYKLSQTKGYAEGTADRVGGYKDSVIGAITGDKSQQTAGTARNEKGQAQQDLNKPTSD